MKNERNVTITLTEDEKLTLTELFEVQIETLTEFVNDMSMHVDDRRYYENDLRNLKSIINKIVEQQ